MTILSLTLLVLRIGTNDPNHSTAVDNLALVTNFFHASPNFHFTAPLFNLAPASESGRYERSFVANFTLQDENLHSPESTDTSPCHKLARYL